MASINLKGYLRETLGALSAGNKIRFTHATTTGETIAGSVTNYVVADDGYYDINIEYGNVFIETSDKSSRSWQVHGTTTINASTAATTLPTLLNSVVPPTDAQILLFQNLVADAENARNASEASAVRSETAAQTSTDNTILMTASEHDAILAQNEEHYAASGMVHMGKDVDESSITAPVNEGLWTRVSGGSDRDTLYLGRVDGSGASKVDFPVSHIAGVVSSIVGIGSDLNNAILLPPAPDGTVIYDSAGDARGTGKANLNLLTETDPKYGDIASTEGEAQSRAFEGECKNGDFRLGDNGDWTSDASGWVIANTGATASNLTSKSLYIPASVSSGAVYTISFVCELASGALTLRDSSGTVFTAVDGVNEVTLTAAGSSIWFGTASSVNATITSLEVRPATEEVVTDRVDMFGLEQFDMVIKDDEVFDMVQSQSATFGDTDVPTVDSVRPDSFFAVYDGQTGIVKGKCVKWSTLTDVQKRKVAAYMKERLWINEDGDLTFTTIRQRTIAGAGNGDWRNVNSAQNNYLEYSASYASFAKPQGMQDSIPQQIGGGFPVYVPSVNASSDESTKAKGAFSAVKSDGVADDTAAYKGRCFFYVLGTVSRLNTGAKAKGVNESGGMAFSDGNKWSSTVDSYATQLDCFKNAHATLSGRDDGRLPQYIYEGGLGGVVDRRLSAYAMSSPEESAKAWEKVKNGTYRGLEKLVFTNAIIGSTTTVASSSGLIKVTKSSVSGSFDYSSSSDTPVVGTLVVDGVAHALDTLRWVSSGAGTSGEEEYWIKPRDNSGFSGANTVTGCFGQDLATSVSGNFTMDEVFGEPANILLTDALKNGWQGIWNPKIPTDSAGDYTYSRKVLGSTSNKFTPDNGLSWGESASWNANLDSTTNSISRGPNIDGGRVYVVTYEAFAKQTKPSTNKPVLNGEAGLMPVAAACYYNTNGSGMPLLQESLIGKVATGNDAWGNINGMLNVELANIRGNGGALEITEGVVHKSISLVAPTNNSQAVKALPYQISDNGQCSIGVQANELTFEAATVNTVADESSVSVVQYGLYKITDQSSLLFGKVIRRIGAANTVNLTGYYIQDGVVYSPSDSPDAASWGVWSGSGWGDDLTMKITADGSDTFVDLNGNTNLSVVHELALPIGWTHNHARVSTQVAGVDL